MTGDNLEQRIRQLLDDGLGKAEIARQLGISRKTLQTVRVRGRSYAYEGETARVRVRPDGRSEVPLWRGSYRMSKR